jgi:hypothetical protein
MSREAMKLALEALDKHDYEMADHILWKALEQPEPEPVECHTCKGLGRIYMGCGSWIHCDTCNTTGKATTPPKREWVGLTDEEVQMFIDARWGDGVNFTHFIRAIEAKLKEKNDV